MLEQLKYWYRAFRYRYKIDAVELNYIIGQLRKGDVAVDIGCHKGGYLFWMQRKVGQTGHCYAFEPQPRLFNYLTSVKAMFGWPHVRLEQKGLSDKAGAFDLFIPKTQRGTSPGATINPQSDKEAFEQVRIKTVTLDEYFLDRNIHPRLIKIDVEGHELEVLQGGARLFQEVKPRILMECENRHLQDRTVMDVFRELEEWGYEGYFILGSKILPLKEFHPDLHQKVQEGRFWEAEGYVNNFIFE